MKKNPAIDAVKNIAITLMYVCASELKSKSNPFFEFDSTFLSKPYTPNCSVMFNIIKVGDSFMNFIIY